MPNQEAFYLDGHRHDYKLTDGNLHIGSSCEVSKHSFAYILGIIRDASPENAASPLWKNRSIASMKREWAVHNLLYTLGIAKSRTEAVDINYPQKWYVRFGYCLVGWFAKLVIK